MLQWACGPRRCGSSFLPCRAGLGSAIMEINPDLRTVDVAVRRRGARRDARARASTSRCCTPTGPTPRQRAVPRPRLVLRRPVRMAADRTFVSCERVVEPSDFLEEGPSRVDPDQPDVHRRRGRGAVRRALHPLRPRLRARRGDSSGSTPASAKDPDAWVDVPRQVHRHPRSRLPPVVEAREWRRGVSRMTRRSGRGLRRGVRRGVARRRRDPGQPDRHDPDHRRAPRRAHLRARPRLHRRRRGAARRRRCRSARRRTPARSSRRGCRSGRCSTSCGRASAT